MKAQNTVLVCVTPQESSQTLVEAGRVLAEKNHAALEVISVLPISANFSKNEPATLEKLFSFAQNAGGQMAVYFSDDPVLTVAAHISKEHPTLLVTGFPGEDSNAFVSALHLLVPDVPISMVSQDKQIYNMLPVQHDAVFTR